MKGAGNESVAPDRESIDSMLVKLCLAIRGAIDSLVLVESTLTGLHSALATVDAVESFASSESFPACSEEPMDPVQSSGSPEPDPVQSSGSPEPDPELELERRMARLKQDMCVPREQPHVYRKED
jgi:hypothetical protein